MRAIGLDSVTLATMVLTATDVRGANIAGVRPIPGLRTKTVPLRGSSNAKLRCGDLADGVSPIHSLIRRSGPAGPGPIRRAVGFHNWFRNISPPASGPWWLTVPFANENGTVLPRPFFSGTLNAAGGCLAKLSHEVRARAA
jgi:hypothetical protein